MDKLLKLCEQVLLSPIKANFRQENQLAKRLAGWGIGEEANPAVCVLNFSPTLKLIHTIHFPLTFHINPFFYRTLGGGRSDGSIED